MTPLEKLRHHVSGAIARGTATAIKGRPMAETILLRTAPNATFPSRTVRLEQVTAGWELAGVGTRETAGYVAVRQTIDGAVYGRKFRSYTAALVEFERLTGRAYGSAES